MSADRWSVCPNCHKENSAAISKMRNELKDKYDKLDLYHWLIEKKHFEKFKESFGDNETLRENWEIYFNEVGLLVIHYYCDCDVCGFHYSFKEEKDIMENQNKINP